MTSIIELALRLWIIKQCESIEIVLIKISSSFKNIIQGKVDNLILNANSINYKGIYINNICLKTSQIKVNINSALNARSISITNKIKVKGFITFNGNDLYKTFSSSKWSDSIFSLLNKDQRDFILSKITISENTFNIECKDKINQNSTKIELCPSLEDKKLYLTNKKLSIKDYFPKDESINLESYEISKDLIILNFSSELS